MPLLASLAIALQGAAVPPAVLSSGSAANGASYQPAISADGEWIAFTSSASDLVEGDVDGEFDVYLRSRKLRTTVRISDATPRICVMPAISGDGRWIAYWKLADHTFAPRDEEARGSLVLHDRVAQTSIELDAVGVGRDWQELPRPASLSHDGARVAFLTFEGEHTVARVYDRKLGSTRAVSVSTRGEGADRDVTEARLSSNGRFVAFCTDALNLAGPGSSPTDTLLEFLHGRQHVFVHDLDEKKTTYASDRALQALGYADYHSPRVSDDGRYVAYDHHDSRWGYAPHVAFLSDLQENLAGRLLAPSAEGKKQGCVTIEWLSRDGRRALVTTDISSLDGAQPQPGATDLYTFDAETKHFRRITAPSANVALSLRHPQLAVSENGEHLAFATYDATAAANDVNGDCDVFVLSLGEGTLELVSVARAK
jgi:Tol biopolymer transport system component